MNLIVSDNLPPSLGDLRHCLKCAKMKATATESGTLISCTLDGVSVMKHVEDKDCPLGIFAAGLGDYLKRFLVRLGIDVTCLPCEMRRKMMNSRFAGMFIWLLDWSLVFHCPACAKGKD